MCQKYCYPNGERSKIVLEPGAHHPEIIEHIRLELFVIHPDCELVAAAYIDKRAGAPYQAALVFVVAATKEQETVTHVALANVATDLGVQFEVFGRRDNTEK